MTRGEWPGPGRELDLLVAEKVLGWRRIEGPKRGGEEPRGPGEVLIPPNVTTGDALSVMPPRGRIPFGFFLSGTGDRYSGTIGAAWGVVENLRARGWLVTVKEMPEGFPFVMGTDRHADPKVHSRCLCELSWMPLGTEEDVRWRLGPTPVGVADTAPHAICLAALQAVDA